MATQIDTAKRSRLQSMRMSGPPKSVSWIFTSRSSRNRTCKSHAVDDRSNPEIWLLVTGDFVRTGGMDIANYMLARHLAWKGCEVHLVAHRVAEELVRSPGVYVHLVPKPFNSYLLGGPLLRVVGQLWAKKIRQWGGRVVVNGGNCRWDYVNWVHYVHAAYSPRVSGGVTTRTIARYKNWMYRRQERKSLENAEVIIANSAVTRNDLVKTLSIDVSKIAI